MINYHQNKLTEAGDFIISHSDLCNIDPKLGGHPKKFYRAMTEPKEEEKKPSFEKGDLLHLWIEKKHQFIIEDLEKPTEKLADFSNEFYNLYCKEQWKNNQVFLEYAKKNSQVLGTDYLTYKLLHKQLHEGDEGSEESVSLLIACIRFAREESEYNKNLKEGTMLTHFEKCIQYILFLKKANGLIVLTPVMRDTLTNCYDSLRKHPFASKLLFDEGGQHEKEYYWTINYPNGYPSINRRAKLDIERADFLNKVLTIIDLKTTSYPVSKFTDPDGAFWRYRTGRQLINYAEGFFRNNPDQSSAEWTINLYNAVVQTNEEYPTMVYKLGSTSMYSFKQELAALELRVTYHLKHNYWDMTREEHLNESEQMILI